MTSRETYVEVVRAVDEWPGWSHTAIALISEGGLLLLALGVVGAAARRHNRDRRAVAMAVTGLAATAVAYSLSALLKLSEAQARPCRAIADLETIATCPPAGDWSLPSNHAVIAAGLAVALTAVAPRIAPTAGLLALLVGASRVALGVHYPHDVATGLLLGAVVVAVLVLLTRAPASRLLEAVAPRVGNRRAASGGRLR